MSAILSDSGSLVIDCELPLAQFTVEQYHQMIEVGAFEGMGRIELLEGYLVRKMTKNPPHCVALGLLDDILSSTIPASWHIANQASIDLDNSVPEPDLMIVAGGRRDYADRHPGPSDVALVVEVADTSLQQDRRKAIIYARNRVSVYWLVNLIDEQVEVFEHPEEAGQQSGYRKLRTFQRGDAFPCEVGGKSCPAVLVDDILP